MSTTIRILGIDPGLRHTGWGVIELSGMRLTHIAHGVISVDPSVADASTWQTFVIHAETRYRRHLRSHVMQQQAR